MTTSEYSIRAAAGDLSVNILTGRTCFNLPDCLWLQHVRLLSRKQFQLRALMQKARKTAGLSDLY